MKAATNLSGIFLLSKVHLHMVCNISHVHVLNTEKPFTLLFFSREGELGRLIVDKHCQQVSHTSGEQSYQNEDNINCNNIDEKAKESDRSQSNYQDLLQYHISCFRCNVCFKILKERDEKGDLRTTSKTILSLEGLLNQFIFPNSLQNYTNLQH